MTMATQKNKPASADAPPPADPAGEPKATPVDAGVTEPEFAPLPDSPQGGSEKPENLSLIMEIPVTFSAELGRSKMHIGNLLRLTRGSVISLDRAVGTPLDIRVNGCLIAHGEVVVVDHKFGIRLLDIVDQAERLKSVS